MNRKSSNALIDSDASAAPLANAMISAAKQFSASKEKPKSGWKLGRRVKSRRPDARGRSMFACHDIARLIEKPKPHRTVRSPIGALYGQQSRANAFPQFPRSHATADQPKFLINCSIVRLSRRPHNETFQFVGSSCCCSDNNETKM